MALLISWTEKPALIGLASGAFFGISAISYRGASLSQAITATRSGRPTRSPA